MGDKISVCNEKKISMNGYFNIKDTYSNLANFIENSLRYDLSVNEYDEQKTIKDCQITANCEATRDIDDTFKIVLKFKLELEGTNVKGEIKNKKIIVQNGKSTLTMNGYIEANWSATRGKGPLASFIGEIYDRFVNKDEQADAIKKADKDVDRIFKRLKTHFNSKLN